MPYLFHDLSGIPLKSYIIPSKIHRIPLQIVSLVPAQLVLPKAALVNGFVYDSAEFLGFVAST